MLVAVREVPAGLTRYADGRPSGCGLQLVSGLSELMSQGMVPETKVPELSQAVHDASRRMLEIVNSLLTTSAVASPSRSCRRTAYLRPPTERLPSDFLATGRPSRSTSV